MEITKWNELQLELFEKIMGQNEIELVEVMDRLEPFIDVWDRMLNILIESSDDIDKYTNLRGMKVINKDGINYLFIKCCIWDYIVIDMDNERALNGDEVKNLFDGDFFIQNMGEKERIGIDNYYIIDVVENKIKYIIYNYINNEELLNKKPSCHYYIEEGSARVGIDINLIKGSVTLCFNELESGRANYIFFDKKLNATGVSNPTGNMEDMKNIADRFKGVSVPLSLIKEYIRVLELKK